MDEDHNDMNDLETVKWRNSQLFTAWRSYASAVLVIVILSVCPSICHTRAL